MKGATREDVAKAIAAYKRVHWGREGTGRARVIDAPNPFFAVPVELGELVQVVYRTKKGLDREWVEYFHDFERERPRLAFNSPSGLLILGGSYRVTTHGIEG